MQSWSGRIRLPVTVTGVMGCVWVENGSVRGDSKCMNEVAVGWDGGMKGGERGGGNVDW